jgi:hypothetical protein
MMNKEPNGADMILQLLGKGECFSNQSADPLPDGAIKALDITGLAGFFANWTMSFAGNYSSIVCSSCDPQTTTFHHIVGLSVPFFSISTA